MSAWLFQDYRQKQKLAGKAPWSVGWIDGSRHRRSKRVGTKTMAEKFRRLLEKQMEAEILENQAMKSWPNLLREIVLEPLSEMIVRKLVKKLNPRVLKK